MSSIKINRVPYKMDTNCINIKSLPPKTRLALYDLGIDYAMHGPDRSYAGWIRILKVYDLFTEDIKLELLPYILGNK